MVELLDEAEQSVSAHGWKLVPLCSQLCFKLCESCNVSGMRQVEVCVKHPALRAIYSKFAVEAFHVENVRFLEECGELLGLTAGQLSPRTLSAIAAKAETLHERVR